MMITMDQAKAKEKVAEYLKQHFIEYKEDTYYKTKRYTMVFRNCEHCPNKILEACIYFYENYMECRVYYSQAAAELCGTSKHISEFMRLLNYINASVWPGVNRNFAGELYSPTFLYTPRIYMTEDGCHDITLTVHIAYEIYELAPLETLDFITASCPELMNELSIPIFMLLLGTLPLDAAIDDIKTNILGDAEDENELDSEKENSKMKYLSATQEGIRDVLFSSLVMKHEWIICCTAENPDDFSTYILENVTRYDKDGHFADMFQNPVFIEYGISHSNDGNYPYRIHDSLMVPITNREVISNLVDNMIETFDAFIIDEGIVDRTKVWGKLGTDYAEKVVFENK